MSDRTHDTTTVHLVASALEREHDCGHGLCAARAVLDALTAVGWRPPSHAGQCGVRYADDDGRWICMRDVPCDLHGAATPPDGGEQDG